MYQFGGDEDPGARGDFIFIISPPRLRLEFCNSDSYIYCNIDPHLYLVVFYYNCLVADPQCISGGCTCHDSFLSWNHNVFFVAMILSVASRMDLQCMFWKLCLVIIF